MIYFFIYAVSILFAYFAERSKNKGIIILCSLISILAPAILGGLRAHSVGIDTSFYGIPDALQALNSPSLAYFISNNRCEPGYKIICYVTMKTLGHPNWCLFFYQLITISCFYIGAYKHRKIARVPLTMLMFLLMYYHYLYNAIRQGMALAIIFMGLDTVEEKHYGKFILYVIAAVLFHYSSVVALPFIMGLHMITSSEKFIKHAYISILLVFLIITLLAFIRPIIVLVAGYVPFLSKYAGYASETSGYNYQLVNASMLLLLGGELVMFTFYGRRASKVFAEAGNKNMKNNANFFKFTILFIFFFQVAVRFFLRVLLYSEFVNMITLSALPNFVREKNLKAMVTLAVILVGVMYFFHRFVFSTFYRTWPYRSILD